VMLEKALPCVIPLEEVTAQPGRRVDGLLDIVGTGGDGKDSFNVSTAASFVVSACGGLIAKHGNRSSTGSFGSTDFLEALGAFPAQKEEGVRRSVKGCGFGYMHGPIYHPSMLHAAAIRKELPFRTVFNLLGPLTNPSQPLYQIIGVGSEDLLQKFSELFVIRHKALKQLHPHLNPRTFIVHSQDGLDEISVASPTHIFVVDNGEVSRRVVEPVLDFGVEEHSLEDVCGGSLEDRVEVFRAVMRGEKGDVKFGPLEVGAVRDFVVMNAAAGLVATRLCGSFREGAQLARQVLETGKVEEVVNKYVQLTKDTSH